MTESYYELLGVEPDASPEEIETAYRETVKQVHPDKNDGPDAEETFMRVQEAHSVLTDPEQRAQYDRRQSATETTESDTDPNGAAGADQRAHDGSSPNEHAGRQREQQADSDEGKRHRRRSSWTDRSDPNRSATQRTSRSRASEHESGSLHRGSVWDTRQSIIVDAVWKGCVTLLWAVGTMIAVVRCPRRLAVDRAGLRNAVTTPTGIRISATVAFVLGATIVAGYLGHQPHESPGIGLTIVVAGLIGSYAGYDLLFPTPYYEPTRQRYDPHGTQRLWPIVATNLFGIGLVAVALIGGAPTGGIAFTVVVLLPVAVSLLLSDLVRPTTSPDHSAGVRHLLGALTRSVSVLPALVIGLLVFTQWGLDAPAMLDSGGWTTATPWFRRLTLGGMHVGLVLNLVVGVFVCASLLWSMYAMCLHLTAAPWTDRYSYGYQVRPGPWNLLVAGPFVVVGWMVVAGVATIEIPVGVSTITITQQGLLMALFFLPSVVTGLYILRRRLEPMFHV